MAAPLEEMCEDEVLDFADVCAEAARRAEVDLLRAAYQWAVLHSAERLDPAESAKPGRERPRQLGGSGTPQVTEFAAASFGARIGRSSYAAARLIADALDLHHRHPQLWARVRAGEVRASYARHVAARTRDLEPDEAAYVDAGVAESADGRICWSRFEALVDAKVAQAAPAAAREQEERAAKATFAKTLRTEARGMASFLIRADIATIDAIDAAVTAKAAQLDTETPDVPDDERRVQAALALLAGDDASVDVQLFVHAYVGPDREGIVRVEGHQPVTDDWVRTVLGPHATFTIRPVLDLAGQAPVDAYEIPDRHRQAVHLMTPADTFPFASCTTRTMQIDHTVPHDEGGKSGVGNYGPMTTTHHRIKTHGRWQVQQPFPGIYLWRDPHGAYYLVDHTGTRRINSAPTGAPASSIRSVVELWHAPTGIELDYAA
ncbi:13E12 repeat family protein [Nocardioides mangrovi]|uniref:13E12 repeat family protein n=1 Tax=Nocardioides mangrovi TaxID=2874580 RepID=A0ABS7UBB4_9ACTN|nr:13E12 repeat family protein [Nocardioides mangrovi]MBZ5737937.1 13E12 repeat family protein [Nocardioides mangrovi]